MLKIRAKGACISRIKPLTFSEVQLKNVDLPLRRKKVKSADHYGTKEMHHF